jgi:hypothetical protein
VARIPNTESCKLALLAFQRRAYAARRLASKRAARDRVAVIYGKEVGGDTAALASRGLSRGAGFGWGSEEVNFDSLGTGSSAAWGTPADASEEWAAAASVHEGGSAPGAGGAAQANAPKPLAAVSPGGAAQIAALRRPNESAVRQPAPPPPPISTSPVRATSDSAAEIDGSMADEYSAAALPVDLTTLSTKGDPTARPRKQPARRAGVSLMEIRGVGGGGLPKGPGGDSLYKSTLMRAGAIGTSLFSFGRGSNADCP